MKKIMFIAAGLMLSIIIFISCGPFGSVQQAEINDFICYRCNGPVNNMEKDAVLQMIRNYYTNQYAALHAPNCDSRLANLDPNCPVDSRAVFFNLDTLKRLIYFIEKAAKNFTQAEKENLGVNIYYASYPQSFNIWKHGWSYTNRHTLIFIPSIFNGETHMAMDIDLFPNLATPAVSSPVYIDKAFLTDPNKPKIAGVYDRSVNDPVMNGQNNGTGTPPPPPPNTGNAILDITGN